MFHAIVLIVLALIFGLPNTSHAITEDSPLWDCRTMGNKQCGLEFVDAQCMALVEPGEISYCYDYWLDFVPNSEWED